MTLHSEALESNSKTHSQSPIIATYHERTRASREIYHRCQRSLPAGTTRASTCWAPHPVTIERGDGPYLWDVDGNRYIDLIYSYSIHVHGNAYPPIAEACVEQIKRGTNWAAAIESQSVLADLLVERIPVVDKVVFTSSGTEAGNLALAIARAATGKHKILMARFGYHGSVAEFQTGMMDRPGPNTIVADYNDAEDFEQKLDAYGDEICAVFLEPVMGAGGVISGTHDFLHRVQAAARNAGALFVIDEVMTLRLNYAGYYETFGLDPDLIMMAKLIGGGIPVGAVGGKAEYMALFEDADRRVIQTGTMSGNPLSMAAGAVSIQELTKERISTMNDLAETLCERLRTAAEKVGLKIRITRAGDLFHFHFSEGRVAFFGATGSSLLSTFFLAALNNGVLMAPRGMGCLSTVCTPSLIDEIVERLSQAMADVVAER